MRIGVTIRDSPFVNILYNEYHLFIFFISMFVHTICIHIYLACSQRVIVAVQTMLKMNIDFPTLLCTIINLYLRNRHVDQCQTNPDCRRKVSSQPHHLFLPYIPFPSYNSSRKGIDTSMSHQHMLSSSLLSFFPS